MEIVYTDIYVLYNEVVYYITDGLLNVTLLSTNLIGIRKTIKISFICPE